MVWALTDLKCLPAIAAQRIASQTSPPWLSRKAMALVGGMLAAVLLSVGAATLAFEITDLMRKHAAPADPAVLTTYLQHMRDEISLP